MMIEYFLTVRLLAKLTNLKHNCRLAQLKRVRTDEHSERRRLLRRSYALDVPSLVMSHCEVGSKDESSVSANIACQLDYDRGMNTVPIIKGEALVSIL